ncbi:MAG: Uma2 family endonuclease [Acidobacteria bacterium]|nr:MAG: Uma2 family endonuclease [Acidobacteriota bacterium]
MSARAFVDPHLFTVAEYYRMADAGVFKADDRVELIEGEIVEMSPTGSRHAGVVDRFGNLLTRTLMSSQIRVQNPVRLNDRSEPLPDVSVLQPRKDFYTESQPTPAEVVFLVEVADSSLMYDRRTKIPLYLRSGIAEVWLVDLVNHAIEVHTPAGMQRFRAGETVISSALPELKIAVDDLPM